MKKKKIIVKCPTCGSRCLLHKADGYILCAACMNLYDKEGKFETTLASLKQPWHSGT